VTMAQALGWGIDSAYPTVSTGHRDALGVGGARARRFVREGLERVILDYRQNAGATGEPITKDVTDTPAPTIGTQSGAQWRLLPGTYSLDEPAPTATLGNDASGWVFNRPATNTAGDPRVFQPGGHHQPGEQSENAIRLTMPELATLQGFPDDWDWVGNKTSVSKQIGNAVPPALAYHLAMANRPQVAP
jgi:site-specific DNA-cytosine methylase